MSKKEYTTSNLGVAAASLALNPLDAVCVVQQTGRKTMHGYEQCEFRLRNVDEDTWNGLHRKGGAKLSQNPDPLLVAAAMITLRQALNRINHEGIAQIEIPARSIRPVKAGGSDE